MQTAEASVEETTAEASVEEITAEASVEETTAGDTETATKKGEIEDLRRELEALFWVVSNVEERLWLIQLLRHIQFYWLPNVTL